MDVAIKFRRFRGDGSEPFDRWIQQWQQVATIAGMDQSTWFGFVYSLLEGPALEKAQTILGRHHNVIEFDAFIKPMSKSSLSKRIPLIQLIRKLSEIRQGNRSVETYAREQEELHRHFIQDNADMDEDDSRKLTTFCEGLSSALKEKLVTFQIEGNTYDDFKY